MEAARGDSRRWFLKSLGAFAVVAGPGRWILTSLTGCARDAEVAAPFGCPVDLDPGAACKLDGALRVIDSNGIPSHEVGTFPNPGCPNAIRPVHHHYELTMTPAPTGGLTPIGWSELGIATTGVPFDPAGPYLEGDSSSGWRFEVTSARARGALGLDLQEAHVQPGGAYHYHGLGPALLQIATIARDAGHPALLGFAADGFPIYGPFGPQRADDPESPMVELTSSYVLKSGIRDGGPGGSHDGTFVADYEYRQGAGLLDEANGRFGVTPEFPDGTHYYVATMAFPCYSRFFIGTPSPTFVHGGDPGLMAVPPSLRNFHG